ncbi:Voltage-gated Ion Channel (VIC) Superfamily [Phytophthora infestans T30-4]|uniref:Voltage-gated Ion Channel (VIC) Superfamily n=1 Tax=Phytophthora infestans (strain T30-4) TaxID=403677 RepID=D0NR31_PHYIT|nr:Voltage-gated Ion Channel (VIC) Superfamily [Phytophthora infestans T30-4]EEY63153.1 Voltage-gated Ion Channel (VIC) Superfamily [Phytophthora infestans T30-4]|eukprot:XP_002898330.1 Voltage-gated Ion Channel (VIC) Superfamily [Phytophthora infestans T30-4]
MIIHLVTCIHFGISFLEGFNPHHEEAWISSINLCLSRLNTTHLEDCNGTMFDETLGFHELQAISFLQYSRSLYYAVGVLASPGKSVKPTTDMQLIAAVILMLSGFLITAIVVDNVQKRFTASAFEQKEFFATSTRIQLFLRRQSAPLAIHHRVKSFLDYWWSSHRGAVIGELLADLPRPIRLNVLKSICLPVLQTLALLQNVRSVQDKLEDTMVENTKFILYGQGEIVYRHGDSVVGMFFLLEGQVYMVEKGDSSREIPRGSFFGTAVLTQLERGEGYTEHVSANSGCILLLVSRDQLQAMELIFPTLKEEFLALEQRLQGNKLATTQSVVSVHDPDSPFVLAWETWVFAVMTLQWALVMLQACYPMESKHKVADALMIFLELSFVLDIQIRSRLGYYEFGNKIMDPVRIKRKYLRSGTLMLDILALIPFFIVNLAVPSDKRWDLLNVNKLLRLFKVPKQFRALETKYLKHTTELRLFKLLYYTFMLSHFLGCIWFNFASRAAVPSFASVEARTPAFGANHWLPSEQLEHGSHVLQYMASLSRNPRPSVYSVL